MKRLVCVKRLSMGRSTNKANALQVKRETGGVRLVLFLERVNRDRPGSISERDPVIGLSAVVNVPRITGGGRTVKTTVL